MPTVAIVGRPNVGKSTLFNRLVGSRRAIVGDEPGITRDRLYGEAEWRGRHLRIVDTGGILPEDKDFIPAEIFRQAKVALEEADAIIMVVDGRTELAAPDIELARQLIRSGKPLFLAVNKVDTDKQQSLDRRVPSPRNPQAVSRFPPNTAAGSMTCWMPSWKFCHRNHQLTTEDTEDAEENRTEDQRRDRHETKVAIIGHPNVGKSTLLNRLTGSRASIVSPIPGTTRDAVDEIVEHDGKTLPLHRYRRHPPQGQDPPDGGKALRRDGAQASGSRRHCAAGDRCHRRREPARCRHRRIRPRERTLHDHHREQVGPGASAARNGQAGRRKPRACRRTSAPAIAKPTKSGCATR